MYKSIFSAFKITIEIGIYIKVIKNLPRFKNTPHNSILLDPAAYDIRVSSAELKPKTNDMAHKF